MRQRHCSGCGSRRRPLKYYEFWRQFVCYTCVNQRVAILIDTLVDVELRQQL